MIAFVSFYELRV